MTAILTLAMGQFGEAANLGLLEDPPVGALPELHPREVDPEVLAHCEVALRGALDSATCSQTTVTDSLRALGYWALPAAWQLLWDPREGSELSASLGRAGLEGRSVLLGLLGKSPPSRVTEFLSAQAFSGLSSEEFLWVLEYLAEQGGADDVSLSLVLGALQAHAGHLDVLFVREQVVRTLRRILERNEQAYSALRAEVVAAPRLHGPPALIALTGLSGARALGVLGDMLEGRLVDATTAAAAIEQVGRRSLPPFDTFLLRSVRSLAQSEVPGERAAALRALGALDDQESIERFIENLQADDPVVRSASNAALEELSGLRFGTDVRRWRAWYSSEWNWWMEIAPQTLQRLSADSKAEVLIALGEVVTHRLDRARLASHVGQLLTHESSDVRRLACVSLGQLGSLVVARELVERLRDIDPSVQESAHSALKLLFEQSLPPDPWAWERYLGEGPATLR